MNNIDELIEKYFEGQTSAEDEAALRHFFTSDDIPENLAMYKPLFAYFDDEINKTEVANANKKRFKKENEDRYENKNRKIQTSKRFVLWLSGAAACAAILVGIFFFEPPLKKCSGEGNYVIINGRCYTDAKTIRSATLNTLREISDNSDDDFPEEKSSEATRIIENQLKEFDSFFDE